MSTSNARSGAYAFLACALLFIGVATLTPGVAFPEFGPRPNVWCFACGPRGGADATLNIALFVPLGIAIALLSRTPAQALLFGVTLSATIETLQYTGFPAGRVANVTDVITNSSGTLAGAIVAYYGHRWLRPSRGAALNLAAAGIVAVAALLSFTGWALGRPAGESPLDGQASVGRSTVEPPRQPLRRSVLPFTPGYGWYHGHLVYAVVDSSTFTNDGNGPLILRGQLGPSLQGLLHISGRDERNELIALLYVHDRGVAPNLFLGQRGADLQLNVNVRASDLRLSGPRVTLSGVFSGTPQEDRVITFEVTAERWRLRAEHGSVVRQTALPISLALGWALFQTVVYSDSPGSQYISFAWMFFLWLPVTFWCRLAVTADKSGATTQVSSGSAWAGLWPPLTALALCLAVIPKVAGIAGSGALEWGGAICGFAAGVFLAWHLAGQRTRLAESRYDD